MKTDKVILGVLLACQMVLADQAEDVAKKLANPVAAAAE